MRRHVLLGLAWAPPLAVLAYAFLRGAEQAFYPEPNPAMLLWADHSPFVWRAIFALYLGGAGAFGGFAAARRSEIGAARGLRALVIASVVALSIQAALWP